MAQILIFLIRIYQHSLGLYVGGHCRFEPSCSNYAIEAVRKHGALRGVWLAAKRIVKCHPWGPFGYDPVPERTRSTCAHQHS